VTRVPESFEVEVPGSLSNLGPGFDVLGMAVTVRNRFRFSTQTPSDGFFVGGQAVDPERHLSFRTLRKATERFGGEAVKRLRLDPIEEVPRTRGLGSSSTARVAGLVAHHVLTRVWPGRSEAQAFLAREEGHPDNVVPALIGGLTLSGWEGRALKVIRVEPAAGLQIALSVPARAVPTKKARAVLPKAWGRGDIVFELSRLAFLMHGLRELDPAALRLGVQDRLHQDHRKLLIGPVDAAFEAALSAGAAGAFISGSGSTLAAFVLGSPAEAEAVAHAMCAVFEAAGEKAEPRVCVPSSSGARYRLSPSAAWTKVPA
jgi:homoserine kinase